MGLRAAGSLLGALLQLGPPVSPSGRQAGGCVEQCAVWKLFHPGWYHLFHMGLATPKNIKENEAIPASIWVG